MVIVDFKKDINNPIKEIQEIFGSKQPATFLVRAQGSARPERFLPQAPLEPPWLRDSAEGRLHG